MPRRARVERALADRRDRVECGVTRRFWIWHGVWPALGFLLLFFWIYAAAADFRVAHSLFYDAASGTWLGAGVWWAEWVHEGGHELVMLVALSALTVVVGSRVFAPCSRLKRDAVFVAVAIALCTGVVGLLKQVTNVDCPSDLIEFGGSHSFVSLFGHRVSGLPRVECFPGAHSASGFSLICFYFVLIDKDQGAARIALVGALLTGCLFAFAQEARGAHFLSHDLTSAAIVWYLQLALYALWEARLRPRVRIETG